MRALWNGNPIKVSRVGRWSYPGIRARVWVRWIGWVRGRITCVPEQEFVRFFPNKMEV